jgi:hypothetical protein
MPQDEAWFYLPCAAATTRPKSGRVEQTIAEVRRKHGARSREEAGLCSHFSPGDATDGKSVQLEWRGQDRDPVRQEAMLMVEGRADLADIPVLVIDWCSQGVGLICWHRLSDEQHVRISTGDSILFGVIRHFTRAASEYRVGVEIITAVTRINPVTLRPSITCHIPSWVFRSGSVVSRVRMEDPPTTGEEVPDGEHASFQGVRGR